MLSSGLIFKYKINRLLSDNEKAHQLKQNTRLEFDPIHQLSVIKANSTYLEVVDKYYALKGWFTMWMLVILMVLMGSFLLMTIDTLHSQRQEWLDLLIIGAMMSPLLIFCTWVLLKESFAYTHYPVRFNRKTRMVHVFMTDGRQLSLPWDDVFFHLVEGVAPEKGEWDLRAHILDKDGKTVLDTFAMMQALPSEEGHQISLREWEFIRRYMEDDHIQMINKIETCLPIDGKRETAKVSLHYLWGAAMGYPAVVSFIYLIILMAMAPFRMIAMHTSKLPKWNKEIEAANVIEADDPYIKDSRINPEGLR